MVVPTREQPGPAAGAEHQPTASPVTTERLTAALLEGDAESSARPLARLSTGTWAGIAATVGLLAIAAVMGVLVPVSSTAWQEPGALVVEQETGVRYVYLDGVLHPVANYSSARLLLGDQLHVVNVPAQSMTAAVRGPAVGIPLAPDSLPDAQHLAGTTWSMCAIGDTTTSNPFRTAVFPGLAAEGADVQNDGANLVVTSAGAYYLIWSARALPVAEQWLSVLGYPAGAAIVTDDAFISGLPTGQRIAPPAVDGVGQPGPPLVGSVEPTVVGSIFADRTNTYYLMTQGGLFTLTPLQSRLLLGDPRLSAAYGGGNPSPLPISAAQVSSSSALPLPAPDADAAAPTTVPELIELPPGKQQLCAVYADQQEPQIVTGPATTTLGPAERLVQVPTGGGALVAARPGPEMPGTTVYLVDDTGTRYPLAGQRAIDRLGLAGASVAQLPAALLDLLPVGPLLDQATASLPGH